MSREERGAYGAPVIFQEVVHSIGTGEAVCDEQAVALEKPNGLSQECPIDDPSSRAVGQKSSSSGMHIEAGRGQLQCERQDRRQVDAPLWDPGSWRAERSKFQAASFATADPLLMNRKGFVFTPPAHARP